MITTPSLIAKGFTDIWRNNMSPVEAHAAEVLAYQKKKYEQELSDDWHTLRQQVKQAALAQQVRQGMIGYIWTNSIQEGATRQVHVGGDPDGPLVPLPDNKAANRAPYAAPAHDYIAALYRPYVSPI